MTNVTSADLDEIVAGQNVPTRFLETVERCRDRVALRQKRGDGWDEWTYGDYAEHVAGAAAYLQGLGVGRGDRVVLMMRNIVDFHMIDLGALFLGATPVSIYNSSSPEQIAYLAGHSGAKVAIVEDDGFLQRFEKVRDELPALEHIVNLADPGVPEELFHGSFDLDAAAGTAQPEDLATIIYTSGTTGPPKGVMITHYNVTWTAESYMQLLDMDPVGKRVVSYLPMAHVAERMASHWLGALYGYEVTACPEASQIAQYCREVKPEIMFGVPRVWEKFYAGVNGALAADAEKKQKFDEAVEAARPIALARAWGDATEEQEQTWAFLDEVAFKGVRELLGLDACEIAVSGAAPIPAEMLGWFRAIGVPMSEIYGMSENTGPMTWEPYKIKPGTVGPAMPGCEVRLAEDGEIVCRGGNVFQGYLNDPEKTADALDDDGWLHTGDIGEVDDDGYFRIVDRKKELIITAGGKNISPANLEAALKMIPLVGQAAAIGDQRPFVSALVVLDGDVAPGWARSQGIEFETLADLARHPDVVAEVERGVAEVMSEFNNAERVKKVTVLSEEWLPDSEELTPTSKLKRRGIHAKYASEIEAIYS